jgi:hypothetical protein
MNLNIQKAKIFVEERLAIVQYAGMWSEVKTRYGTSLVYNNERWPDTKVVRRDFKVSFNTKSITIAEEFAGKWKVLHEINEKQCADWLHVKDILTNFTPALSPDETNRADRRFSEAVRGLTGSQGSDVAVTVSAGAAKAPSGIVQRVAAPKRGKKFNPKDAPVELKETVIESAGTAVVEGQEIPVVKFTENELLESGDMSFTPPSYEQSVARSKRENPHKVTMEKMLIESGLAFEKTPTKHGVAYSFEGITITFSGTMLKVSALVEWLQGKDDKPVPFYATWVSGKYEHDQCGVIADVLAICKEVARLRTMACFNIPEIAFSHSECNFITDRKELPHYRSSTHYISINYRVEGFNHDKDDMQQVRSIRYSRNDLITQEGQKLPKNVNMSEKQLTASVTCHKLNDIWNSRYWNPKTPTKRMSIECEEVSYTTNRDLLNSFGLKIGAETREKEYHTVNVPLDRVPVKS